MNITYLIGNGFDIAAGLNTRYSDFYNYIINSSELNKNRKNEILESIENNTDLWSDLELGLGDYTKHIRDDKEKLEKFYIDKFDIDIKLSDYLEKEQKRIDWKQNRKITSVKEDLIKYIYNFHELFKPVERDEILKIKNSFATIDYKVISFNYTNVIKNCLNLFQNSIELVYLHGSLEKNNVILGVNDSDQINNEIFKETEDMLISMNKLEINKDIGEYTVDKAEEILKYSGIVCIYGMSVGDTDKYWWEKIINNIIKDTTKMVVIFHYDPNLNMRNRVEILRTKNRVIEQLLKYYSGDDEIKNKIKNKIKVLCNSDMFKLNLLFKDESEFENLLKLEKNELVAQ